MPATRCTRSHSQGAASALQFDAREDNSEVELLRGQDGNKLTGGACLIGCQKLLGRAHSGCALQQVGQGVLVLALLLAAQ